MTEYNISKIANQIIDHTCCNKKLNFADLRGHLYVTLAVQHMWPDLQKGTFFTHKIFDPLNLNIVSITAYNCLKFSTFTTTVFGYMLTQSVT